jgi:hypothetical protein
MKPNGNCTNVVEGKNSCEDACLDWIRLELIRILLQTHNENEEAYYCNQYFGPSPGDSNRKGPDSPGEEDLNECGSFCVKHMWCKYSSFGCLQMKLTEGIK